MVYAWLSDSREAAVGALLDLLMKGMLRLDVPHTQGYKKVMKGENVPHISTI